MKRITNIIKKASLIFLIAICVFISSCALLKSKLEVQKSVVNNLPPSQKIIMKDTVYALNNSEENSINRSPLLMNTKSNTPGLNIQEHAILYRFLQEKINQITKELTNEKPFKINIIKDTICIVEIDSMNNFYVSTQQLQRFNNLSEMASFFIHELIHHFNKDLQIRVIKNIIPNNLFYKTLDWKRKEFKTDSLTLITLLKLNYYPNSFADKTEKKETLYIDFCNSFKEERVIKINKLWVQIGMPSNFLRIEEFKTFKEYLNKT